MWGMDLGGGHGLKGRQHQRCLVTGDHAWSSRESQVQYTTRTATINTNASMRSIQRAIQPGEKSGCGIIDLPSTVLTVESSY